MNEVEETTTTDKRRIPPYIWVVVVVIVLLAGYFGVRHYQKVAAEDAMKERIINEELRKRYRR